MDGKAMAEAAAAFIVAMILGALFVVFVYALVAPGLLGLLQSCLRGMAAGG